MIYRINKIKIYIWFFYFVVFGGKISGGNGTKCTVARVTDLYMIYRIITNEGWLANVASGCGNQKNQLS